jgi:hypothetical protein
MFNINRNLKNNKIYTAGKIFILCLVVVGFAYGCQRNGKNKQRSDKKGANTAQPKQKEFGHHGKNNPTNLNSNSKSPRIQEIRKNWKNFFSSKTKNKTRMNLLQNGKKFKKSIQHFSNSKMGKNASATISKVSFNGTKKKVATVTYTINLNNKPVLKNQDGKAIYANNMWKVSDETFCNLLSMSGKVPSACPQSNKSNS